MLIEGKHRLLDELLRERFARTLGNVQGADSFLPPLSHEIS